MKGMGGGSNRRTQDKDFLQRVSFVQFVTSQYTGIREGLDLFEYHQVTRSVLPVLF